MAYISADDRSQLLLLPDAVDDWVGADNPVRVLEAFVAALDLERARFERVQSNGTGGQATIRQLHAGQARKRVEESSTLFTGLGRRRPCISEISPPSSFQP
ncbi:MAG: hypothetical protein KTV45_16265, partial [Acidimicrobiia bacterium]|nr:hypothetical protein [Acidimicrobiia bacterium]